MYREAMEHLMAVPPSKTSSSTCRSKEETKLGVTSTDSCGGEDKPADAALKRKEASNTTTTTTVLGLNTDEIGHIEEAPTRWAAQPRASKEHLRLLDDLDKVKKRRAAVSRERDLLARRRAELARCRAELLSRRIVQEARRSDVAEARENCRSRRALYSTQLVSAMSMGALNDSFHIWHLGPFATINGFRVGRLSTHLVDWQEVNAGVGQAAIVLVSVAISMGVEFSKYLIAPCGSFTKIARSGDGRVLYSLHTDESFSLFPRRNFNLALKAFLTCLGEVGEHVQEHDPTLRLPYDIKEHEGTIGGLPVALGSSLEDWTRALKYMMTDLKWIAAWAAKYLPPC